MSDPLSEQIPTPATPEVVSELLSLVRAAVVPHAAELVPVLERGATVYRSPPRAAAGLRRLYRRRAEYMAANPQDPSKYPLALAADLRSVSDALDATDADVRVWDVTLADGTVFVVFVRADQRVLGIIESREQDTVAPS